MPENTEKNKQKPVEHIFYPPSEEELKEAYAEYKNVETVPFRFHCKPTYNFQSIEFEMEVDLDDKESLDRMQEAFSEVLSRLVKASAVAPTQEERPELATERQKQIMKAHGIKFDANTTNEEAQKLIEASIEKAKKQKKK